MQHPPLCLIIFDFDGVIAESIAMKAEAFRETFSFVPRHQDEIVQYHLDNGGMNRYAKFRFIYREILCQELTRDQEQRLGDRYAGLVREKMYTIPLVPGADKLLSTCSTRLPLYIVSATPEDEMLMIAEKQGLKDYFVRIYGSPRSKADCIREILATSRIDPTSALFIGDAPQDLEAAEKTGVRFIARVAAGDPDRFTGHPHVERVVSDMHELLDYLFGRSG
ncbi:MAG: HAD family hydrolase [Methanocalculus sp. MSAO_Arc1]|uniref:HAD family hydrolase n=1 Tax=Methanocalculus TaxID=71151 RepID=UPI000FEFFA72|nr:MULTISPECIES: HAD-IA family hydrolase [unclassified Methanocalculus]MCP1661397.1 phosphoglycolate phosphatase-like HAD superfamily hydrolase [Methanocalculus sp. AMF5]RQD79703.1 MAG: HAD family hydrolase [Methanocalculus sp. MSAO_Arc1]